MSEESQDDRLARLEGRLTAQEAVTNKHDRSLYGVDDKGGLINDFKDLKTENKYLRLIYILATALALPAINAVITRLGFGPIKIGG